METVSKEFPLFNCQGEAKELLLGEQDATTSCLNDYQIEEQIMQSYSLLIENGKLIKPEIIGNQILPCQQNLQSQNFSLPKKLKELKLTIIQKDNCQHYQSMMSCYEQIIKKYEHLEKLTLQIQFVSFTRLTEELSNHKIFQQQQKNNPFIEYGLPLKCLTSLTHFEFKYEGIITQSLTESLAESLKLKNLISLNINIPNLPNGINEANNLGIIISNFNLREIFLAVGTDSGESQIVQFLMEALKNKRNLRILSLEFGKTSTFDSDQLEGTQLIANAIKNAPNLSVFRLKLNDESIKYEGYQKIIDELYQINKIKKMQEITINVLDSFSILFYQLFLLKVKQLTIRQVNSNHSKYIQYSQDEICFTPKKIDSVAIFNFTKLIQFSQFIKKLSITFPKKIQNVELKEENLIKILLSATQEMKLEKFALIIEEGNTIDLLQLVEVIGSQKTLQQLKLHINNNQKFQKQHFKQLIQSFLNLNSLSKVDLHIKEQDNVFLLSKLLELPLIQNLILQENEIYFIKQDNILNELKLNFNSSNYKKEYLKDLKSLSTISILNLELSIQGVIIGKEGAEQIEKLIHRLDIKQNLILNVNEEEILRVVHFASKKVFSLKIENFIEKITCHKVHNNDEEKLLFNLQISFTKNIHHPVIAFYEGLQEMQLKSLTLIFPNSLDFEEKQLEQLGKMLNQQQQIEELTLSLHSNSSNLQGIYQGLSSISNLKKLNLQIIGFHFYHFLSLIQNLEHLILLKLNNIEFEFSKIDKTFKCLRLPNLTQQEAELFCNELSQFYYLETLELIAEDFGGEEQEKILCEGILQLKNLRNLKVLQTFKPLKSLIFHALFSLQNLRKENLNINQILELNYLSTQRYLSVIVPKSNFISQAYMLSLNQLLSHFPNIQTLSIVINSYVKVSIEQLTKSLFQLQNLQALSIEITKKSKYQFDLILFKAISEISNLQELSIKVDNKDIDSDQMNNIVKQLANSNKIKKLTVNWNSPFIVQFISAIFFLPQLEPSNFRLQMQELTLFEKISWSIQECFTLDLKIINESVITSQGLLGLKKGLEGIKQLKALNIQFDVKSSSFQPQKRTERLDLASIFSQLKLDTFNLIFNFNIYQPLKFEKTFESMQDLESLSIQIKEESIDQVGFNELIESLDCLDQLKSLNLEVCKNNITINQGSILNLINRSQLKQISLSYQDQIDYEQFLDIINILSTQNKLQKLKLSLILPENKLIDSQQVFNMGELKNLKELSISLNGYCPDICKCIYKIITQNQFLTNLIINLEKNISIQQEQLQYINLAFQQQRSIKLLTLNIKSQQGYNNILQISNLNHLTNLKYLELGFDEDNIGIEEIENIYSQIKYLKNLKQFVNNLTHPYSTRLFEVIQIYQLDNTNSISKFVQIQKCAKNLQTQLTEELSILIKSDELQLKNPDQILLGLVTSLQNFKYLQSLSLTIPNFLIIDNNTGEYLYSLFKNLQKLKYLSLNIKRINIEGSVKIKQAIEQLNGLQQFQMTIGEKNFNSSEGIVNLIGGFLNKKGLIQFSLTIHNNNKVEQSGINTICASLKNNYLTLKNVQIIIHDDNEIQDGIRQIAENIFILKLDHLQIYIGFNKVNSTPTGILTSISEITQLKTLNMNIQNLEIEERKAFVLNVHRFKELNNLIFQNKNFIKDDEESETFLNQINKCNQLISVEYLFKMHNLKIKSKRLTKIDSRFKR